MSDYNRKKVTETLTKEFPREAIKRRQGGRGRMFDYIEGHAVIHRLIDATDNTYDVRVVDLRITDKLVMATVELTIPGLGTRQHVGVQAITGAPGTEDLMKGAVTDGLKKAATLFGVGLELYGEDYEGEPAPQRPAQASKAASKAAPRPAEGSGDAKARRDEVAKVIDGSGWTLDRAVAWFKANRGVASWGDVGKDDIEALITAIWDGDGPAATTQAAASGGDDWIARIEAAGSSDELAALGNELLKAVRDADHPARVRLKARFAELAGMEAA